MVGRPRSEVGVFQGSSTWNTNRTELLPNSSPLSLLTWCGGLSVEGALKLPVVASTGGSSGGEIHGEGGPRHTPASVAEVHDAELVVGVRAVDPEPAADDGLISSHWVVGYDSESEVSSG